MLQDVPTILAVLSAFCQNWMCELNAQTDLKDIFSKAFCEGAEDFKKNERLDKSTDVFLQ